MKKIMIIYATAGIGHKKASFAVKKAFDELAPKDIEVSIIDALDYTNTFFKWSYLKLYLLMVNRLPLFWGLMYYLTDNYYLNLFVAKLRRLSNWLNSRRLREHLLSSRPDVVISTHFFAGEVISDLKKKGLLSSRLITVVTDYRLHSWWVTDYVDAYVVGGEGAKMDLIRWDVDASKIKTLGIPAEPIFSKDLDTGKILDKTGLKKDIFTILVIGGGFGVGPIEDIVKIINDISMPVQIVAICGHNEELVNKLEGLRPTLKVYLKVLGFVDNVYEYMAISDLLISKSGGITVTESLAKELPMLIISPIIGQETRNSDFLVDNGAALKIDKLSDLKDTLNNVISHSEQIDQLRRSICKIRKPMACYDIAKLTMEMAEHG